MGHLNYARIEDLYPATSFLQYTKLFSVWNTYEVKIAGVVWAIPLKGSVLISSNDFKYYIEVWNLRWNRCSQLRLMEPSSKLNLTISAALMKGWFVFGDPLFMLLWECVKDAFNMSQCMTKDTILLLCTSCIYVQLNFWDFTLAWRED